MRPTGSRAAAASVLVDELRELARSRADYLRALRAAIEGVQSSSLHESLMAVVEPLPLVVDADAAAIRVSDEHGTLHLVAAIGSPANAVLPRALQPVDAEVAARLSDPRSVERRGREQGFRWVQLTWLGVPESPLGSLVLASRTDRRPQLSQLSLLDRVTRGLSERLLGVDRSARHLRACSLQLAQSLEIGGSAEAGEGGVSDLRPRERSILGLYADGLSTRQIAALLVISPHTVRTHVKTALRTLGLHTRREAVRLVRASQEALLL